MVDNTNPTTQFHPYQPVNDVPQADRPVATGLGGLLNSVRNVNFKGGLNKARGVAGNNGALVLGGLAALVIGAGMMRKRSMAARQAPVTPDVTLERDPLMPAVGEPTTFGRAW